MESSLLVDSAPPANCHPLSSANQSRQIAFDASRRVAIALALDADGLCESPPLAQALWLSNVARRRSLSIWHTQRMEYSQTAQSTSGSRPPTGSMGSACECFAPALWHDITRELTQRVQIQRIRSGYYSLPTIILDSWNEIQCEVKTPSIPSERYFNWPSSTM